MITVLLGYIAGMLFLKEHLSGNNNYIWADESFFTGKLSRRLFNRYNGNQLLFIINHYASHIDGFTINTGLQIEDLLINKLPAEAKSEISVLKWLKENQI